jgi:hypothetical protein
MLIEHVLGLMPIPDIEEIVENQTDKATVLE